MRNVWAQMEDGGVDAHRRLGLPGLLPGQPPRRLNWMEGAKSTGLAGGQTSGLLTPPAVLLSFLQPGLGGGG